VRAISRPRVKRPAYTLSWELPYGARAFFGGPEFDLVKRENRVAWLDQLDPSVKEWVVPLQQHGGTVLTEYLISSKMENACDGLVSRHPERGVAVIGSDCPGLLLVAPGAVAAIHCGWRGMAEGIVANAFACFFSSGDNSPQETVAIIGPGICGECYTVGPEVIEACAWSASCVWKDAAGRYHLDLPSVIASQCRSQGIEDVRASGICTHCDSRLHSYRYDGPGVIQVFAITPAKLSAAARPPYRE
jgi:YfiH family protein